MTATEEYDAQRTAIVAAVSSVTDVGRVHDRPRHGDFRDRWVTTINGIPQIRAWEVKPGLTEVIRREQGRRHRYRTWEITGMVGLEDLAAESDPDAADPADTYDDASFHVIERLAGEIADAIDTARTAHTAAGVFTDHETPTQISEPQVVTIGGGALCWGITLTITGWTVVTP